MKDPGAKLKVGSDFSGVGAFNQALIRLGVDYEEIFACDRDKYARQTFIHNYGEPKYYPTDVYEREIPTESLDIYMTSPPCQAFSMAGRRLGKEDKRGILFFNSLEFIQQNKPRFFIFENVKGLLSDDSGKTFQEWINFLGGKSVNGLPVLFPEDDSVPYHLYWKILNAKEHAIPQNRERVFLIGIRDDNDNNFRFPIEEHLTKKLKDILENDVDEKYFLREASLNNLLKKQDFNKFKPLEELSEYSNVISARCNKVSNDNPFLKVFENTNPSEQGIKIKSATSKGYEEAVDGDSISLAHPTSNTRRGRVGKQISQTIDCDSNMGVMNNYQIRRLTPRECFRLMDFPESFKWLCSDSQAYKQAGNSIVVNVLYKILKNLNL